MSFSLAVPLWRNTTRPPCRCVVVFTYTATPSTTTTNTNATTQHTLLSTGVYGGKGSGPYEPRPWCSNTIPSAYGYVQKVYWHVGFLKYYRVNQVGAVQHHHVLCAI